MKFKNYFVDHNLLSIFTRVSKIGCPVRFGVLIQNLSNESEHNIDTITNKLSILPETRIYKGKNLLPYYDDKLNKSVPSRYPNLARLIQWFGVGQVFIFVEDLDN